MENKIGRNGMPIYHLSQVGAVPELAPKSVPEPELGADIDTVAESDYESEGGTHYSPKDVLGKGKYARARRFDSEDGKAVVVLDSVHGNRASVSEVNRKHRFFANQYPEKKSYLFRQFLDPEGEQHPSLPYRMVVPLISGVTYSNYLISVGKIKDIAQQIHLFLSLVAELTALHAKGFIYLDFKGDNVLYDASTGKSHLIDGGLSVKLGEAVPDVFREESEHLLNDKRQKYRHIAPECWTVMPSPPVIAHPSMDVFSLAVFLRERLFEWDLDVDILSLTRSCRLPNATNRTTLNDLSVALNALLCKRKYQGYVRFMQQIANDESDPLCRLIQLIAQNFILQKLIRSYDRENNQEKDSYLLQALPESEQHLFLEIAGHVLFSYLVNGKLAELELPVCYQVSMEAETLTIRYKTGECQEVSADGIEKTVDVFAKKSWKINIIACECAFSALIRMNPKLESFIHDINAPATSALMLWKQLYEPAVQRSYHGYRAYMQSVANREADPLLVLIQCVAQDFLLNKIIRAYDRENNQEKGDYSLQTLSESERSLFLEIAGHVLFSYFHNGKLSALALPAGFQLLMEEDTFVIRNKIGQRIEFGEDDSVIKVDVFCKTSLDINKIGCECAFFVLARENPKLQHYIYEINDPVFSARELWKVLIEDYSKRYDSLCVIC